MRPLSFSAALLPFLLACGGTFAPVGDVDAATPEAAAVDAGPPTLGGPRTCTSADRVAAYAYVCAAGGIVGCVADSGVPAVCSSAWTVDTAPLCVCAAGSACGSDGTSVSCR